MPDLLLTKPPELILVPTPDFPAAALAEVTAQRERIAQSPGMFDGMTLMALSADEQCVHAYETTFSVRLAHTKLANGDGISPLGLGGLAVSLYLRDERERVLAQLRASNLLVSPGMWASAVNGAVDPDDTFDGAIARETFEELGIGVDALDDLRCAALLTGGNLGCMLTYQAQLRPGIELRPNPEEVEGIAWIDGPELPEPYTQTFGRINAALNRALQVA